jgi:hypothetical protein
MLNDVGKLFSGEHPDAGYHSGCLVVSQLLQQSRERLQEVEKEGGLCDDA